MTDTTDRKPLTPVTWASLNYTLTPETHRADGRPLGWEGAADLGFELAALLPHVPVEGWRVLVDFLGSLPVTLEWSHPFGDGRREVTRATGIVEYMHAPRPEAAHVYSGQVRFRYPGFSHYVYLRDIRSITHPETTYTYEDQPAISAPE